MGLINSPFLSLPHDLHSSAVTSPAARVGRSTRSWAVYLPRLALAHTHMASWAVYLSCSFIIQNRGRWGKDRLLIGIRCEAQLLEKTAGQMQHGWSRGLSSMDQNGLFLLCQTCWSFLLFLWPAYNLHFSFERKQNGFVMLKMKTI